MVVLVLYFKREVYTVLDERGWTVTCAYCGVNLGFLKKYDKITMAFRIWRRDKRILPYLKF